MNLWMNVHNDIWIYLNQISKSGQTPSQLTSRPLVTPGPPSSCKVLYFRGGNVLTTVAKKSIADQCKKFRNISCQVTIDSSPSQKILEICCAVYYSKYSQRTCTKNNGFFRHTQENHVRAMKVKKKPDSFATLGLYMWKHLCDKGMLVKKTPWKHPRLKSWRFLQQTQALRP